MQKITAYLQLGALLTIITPHIAAKTTNTESQLVEQLYKKARRNSRIHEPSSVITSQNQNQFPKKKHELLSERIGVIDEKVQQLSADQNKVTALTNLNQRIENLKQQHGVTSDLDSRLFMAPLERAKFDQQTLNNLKARMVMVKKKLDLEQKYFELSKKNLSKDMQQTKSIQLANLASQLATAKQQFYEKQKNLSELNKKSSIDAKNKLRLQHEMEQQKQKAEQEKQRTTRLEQEKNYTDTQKKLFEQQKQLKTEEKALLSAHKNLIKDTKAVERIKLGHLNTQLSNAKHKLEMKQKNLLALNEKSDHDLQERSRLEQEIVHQQETTDTNKKLTVAHEYLTKAKQLLGRQQAELKLLNKNHKTAQKRTTQLEKTNSKEITFSTKTAHTQKKAIDRKSVLAQRKQAKAEQQHLKLAARQAKQESKQTQRLAMKQSNPKKANSRKKRTPIAVAYTETKTDSRTARLAARMSKKAEQRNLKLSARQAKQELKQELKREKRLAMKTSELTRYKIEKNRSKHYSIQSEPISRNRKRGILS